MENSNYQIEKADNNKYFTVFEFPCCENNIRKVTSNNFPISAIIDNGESIGNN